MKSLHIRDLDEAILAGLKRRAQRHHRSLQKEVTVLLTDAAQMVPADAPLTESPLRQLRLVETGHHDSKWARDEIYSDDGR